MSDYDLARLTPILQELAPQGRPALLPALQAAQSLYGYIPEPVALQVGQALGVPLADVFGVIDFYSLLYRQPVGKTVIQVCQDPACALSGADALFDSLCHALHVAPGEPTSDGAYSVEHAPCLGLCNHAPALLMGDQPVGGVHPAQVAELLHAELRLSQDHLAGDVRLLTANCGKGRPATLDEYLAGGGYAGLQRALKLSSPAVIAELKESGLVGRGGAAFPTGVKWEAAAQAEGEPKYVVCNADESEPGTFKDRILIEQDPQRLLEGMVIAAYAIGAHQGFIYLRGEYPRAYAALSAAIQTARQAGYLGENILNTGFSFDVALRQGAGAYICGEETALFESIEGKRGFPRLRPPFPTTYGLFGKPTVINNVETLCNLPFILAHGAAAYRQHGTQKSPGTKLFCLSGDVARPGLYELPFGVTLRELIFGMAGGVPNGSALKAVLLGGAAGAFATPDQLDVPLSFEDLRAAGLPLGSGVIMLFDESRDLRDVLRRLARFFAHESCGKCYPCQLGTQRQLEILERVASGSPLPGDAQRLSDVGWTMNDASLCGLGQTAASAVLSALKLWPDLFMA